jgi:DNA-binding ferritin-like protein
LVEKHDDTDTEDILTLIATELEKNASFLRASLET